MDEYMAMLIIFVGMLIFVPLISKLLNFIGRKAGIWKPYFRKKGKRYGTSNTVKTHFGGKVAVVLGEFLKAVFLFVVTLIFWTVIPEGTLKTVFQGIFVCVGLYGLFILGQFMNCDCIYCSTSREEVDQFVEKISEKNQFFKSKVEIRYEDGWHMIFPKKPEECKRAMLEHPNFFVRECPARLKKLNSFRYELLYLLPGILIGVGCNYVANKFFSINQDITAVLMLLTAVPCIYRLLKERTELYKECKARFREEENLPEDKYKVEGHYSSAEGGRLIFTVKPIEESEGN